MQWCVQEELSPVSGDSLDVNVVIGYHDVMVDVTPESPVNSLERTQYLTNVDVLHNFVD